jgi:uncharacterized protein YqjF (DUF2071 family)
MHPMTARLDARCPTPVRTASMTQRWDSVTFVHFEYEPSDLASVLPDPLRPDCWDGAAWVSLVALELQHVRVTGLPPLPGAHRFGALEVRAPVVTADGTPGLHAFSLDASSVPAMIAGRIGYRLPCHVAVVDVERSARAVRYTTRRRLATAACSLLVEHRDALPGDELDVFLTARWDMLTVTGDQRVRRLAVEHDPWPLHQAHVAELDDSVVAAAGLPPPQHRMFARFSPGVDVRIGLPRRLPGAGPEQRRGRPTTMPP